MAYTDFGGKIILQSWGKFRLTLLAACSAGDLLSRRGYLADADAARPAASVSLEDGAIADVIWVAKKAEVMKPPTIGASGAVTAGDHGGTAGDVLWLSTTAGDASEAPLAGIGQLVGKVLSTERVLLEPAETFDPLVELVAADKTLDIQDVGKQLYVTVDAKTVTLPAIATGLHFEIVNGGQFGDVKIDVDPNDADLIAGPDVAGADKKSWYNTKATANPGDRIVLDYKDAAGYIVTKVIGTWTQEE